MDQVTGEAVASIPTSRISQPAEAIYAEGTFWVHNLDPTHSWRSTRRTDACSTRSMPRSTEVQAFAVDGDTLWVTGPYTAKIDIGLGTEIDHFDLPRPGARRRGGGGIAVGDDALRRLTLRLDPATGEVEASVPRLPGSFSIAYGDGSIWTAGWIPYQRRFHGSRRRESDRPDHRTRVTKNPLVLPPDCCSVAAGGGFGWTADPTKGVVYKIDEVGQVAAIEPTGPGASIGSYNDGVAWVANSDVGTVVGIEALTGDRRTFRFEHPIQGLAAGSGVVLVTLGPGRTYEEVIDGLQGDVARFVRSSPARLEILDPAILESAAGVLGGVGDLRQPPELTRALPWPDGLSLQPEIAASIPDVSSGRPERIRSRSDPTTDSLHRRTNG